MTQAEETQLNSNHVSLSRGELFLNETLTPTVHPLIVARAWPAMNSRNFESLPFSLKTPTIPGMKYHV